ncbi:MAG: PAS domain-containing protein [Promethearchaeota archaeon]
MSEIKNNEVFSTKIKSETFLRFADNSRMGVLIIQRGYLKYFNKQFIELFGYNKQDILNWRKREFYKIVHPDDLPNLVKNFKIEDDRKTVTVQFRGIKKNKNIIPIENYICYIKYNNKTAYLSSYISLEKPIDEFYIPEIIKTKEEKIITLKYQPIIVKLLEDNNIDFKIIKHYSYREEK